MRFDDNERRGANVLARLAPAGAAPPWESLADFAPALGATVAHAFGTVIGGSELDLRTRELVTIAMLAAIGGCEPQLTFHIGGARRAGASQAEIVSTLTQVAVYAGIPRALNAIAIAREVLEAPAHADA
jgi:4-carboxymuconolactone decarboxylase